MGFPLDKDWEDIRCQADETFFFIIDVEAKIPDLK
jgi:hypothetical protein